MGTRRRIEVPPDHAPRDVAPPFHDVAIGGMFRSIELSKCVSVDLHGKKSFEVERQVLYGLDRAIREDKYLLVLIHGFKGGTVLMREAHRVLEDLQNKKQVVDFRQDRLNQGQTVAVLAR